MIHEITDWPDGIEALVECDSCAAVYRARVIESVQIVICPHCLNEEPYEAGENIPWFDLDAPDVEVL